MEGDTYFMQFIYEKVLIDQVIIVSSLALSKYAYKGDTWCNTYLKQKD